VKKEKSYIFQSFAIIVMASGFFLFFKNNLPQRIFSEDQLPTKNVVVDSLLLQAFEEEEQKKTESETDNSTEKKDEEISEEQLISNEALESFSGMIYLEPFFAQLYKLEQLQQGNVRIAYYGDSMTDGDMIVQDLRKNYQDKYGGGGVGYVSITSESAQSRASVIHQYSNNWKVQSYLNVKKPTSPFGISGHVFFTNDTVNPSWVSYKAGGIRHLTNLEKPILYYGKSANMNGKVAVVIDNDTIINPLSPVTELNKLKLTDKTALKQIKLLFSEADSIPVYGVDFSTANGVQIDNFSSRGNSGLPLSLFNTGLMQKYQKDLNYNLIVLHYGTNVLNYGSLNYSWYTRQMTRVVNHLKQCFPKAAILVISTADKATKYDLEMKTDSAVVPLVKAQRKYAIEAHTGFFNLYEAMGGEGSMMVWAEDSPAKANKDYTHFNYRGAQEVAGMMFKHLEEGYEAYKKQRVKKEKEAKLKSDSIKQKKMEQLQKMINDSIIKQNEER
jgi:lysophospholipase L1-like esterase